MEQLSSCYIGVTNFNKGLIFRRDISGKYYCINGQVIIGSVSEQQIRTALEDGWIESFRLITVYKLTDWADSNRKGVEDPSLNEAVKKYISEEYPDAEIFFESGSLLVTEYGSFQAYYEDELEAEGKVIFDVNQILKS